MVRSLVDANFNFEMQILTFNKPDLKLFVFNLHTYNPSLQHYAKLFKCTELN